ncbi:MULTISPECIES: GNAT family N-acetyltransferase [Actinoplanes]|uniref:GNAT family N-acetyltransferase n=1 Tax=Actinoplanes TaxID=1865 RepID=UPI0009F8AE28|nr:MULTISPECIES: GNAT family N-acetyltransferase [Actinoplanes]GLY00869.1 hypothetical protein Acsp01_12480 [Actinoplanes sp. NBRC 101535]
MRWQPWWPSTRRATRHRSVRRIPRFPDRILRGGNVVLRDLRVSDAEDLVTGVTDATTQRWLPLPHDYTVEHALTFITRTAPGTRIGGAGLVRAIEAEGRFAGLIDLKRTDWTARVTEIGYWAMPGSRGRGVVTEATSILARWVLQELGFERTELRVATGNIASNRVAVKAGFRREGVARSAGITHGGRVDLVIYSRIRSDL